MSQPDENDGKQTSDESKKSDEGQDVPKGKLKGTLKGEFKGEFTSEGKDEDKDDQKGGEKSGQDDEGKSKDGKGGDSEKNKPAKKPLRKRPGVIIAAIVIVLVLVVGGLVFWLIARHYVSTDDAFIDSHVSQISAQIGARVVQLRIDDNQLVHKGDVLVRLDPTDYQVALDQAKAQVISARGRLDQAKAQAIAADAAVQQAVAQQDSAQASFGNATRDVHRFESVEEGARSKQQLDQVRTTSTNAQATLESSKAGVATASANVNSAKATIETSEGQLKAAEANEKQAEVNLAYCEIIAPIDGRITERTVEVGNYVTTGQPLFMIVDLNVWVTANFKETQLTHMQPGQPVTIKVDAFPGHKFQGHVDSIQAGSGSRFSVLPAENATGNYVKIVQRVPVKIVFEHDANTNNALMLSPGLSVKPRVKVR